MTSVSDALKTNPIVSADWLRDNHSDVVIVDARAYLDGREGRDAHAKSHIASARFLDLKDDFSAKSSPEMGGHPLPSPEAFADSLARVGIGHDTPVVVYDDSSGMIAGRLVWMLRVLGQPAALLDGGIDAWSEPLATVAEPFEPVENIARPWPEDSFVDADAVAAFAEQGGVVVDTRDGRRFRGKGAETGHIPGAINHPFPDNLQAGRFRDIAELGDRYRDAGIDETTIFYCGSGVSACHNLLVAESAGLGRGRLYVASWSGWSSEGRSAETGG